MECLAKKRLQPWRLGKYSSMGGKRSKSNGLSSTVAAGSTKEAEKVLQTKQRVFRGS